MCGRVENHTDHRLAISDTIGMQYTEHGKPLRTVEEAKAASRSRVRSAWRSTKEAVAGAPQLQPQSVDRSRKPRVRDWRRLLGSAFLEWIKEFFANVFRRRPPLLQYPEGRSGIYRLPTHCRIALASDWGTGTESAYAVGVQIGKREPDVTIHLGDVYYSGTGPEYEAFFLGEGCWPRGRLQPGHSGLDSLPTYALNANHEMYSGGQGYFAHALPALGQFTSHFCLENEHWRIVGIDTGYHCARGIRAALNRVLGDTTRLDEKSLAWLCALCRDDGTRRPVILLSHHQWFSAFERGYPKLGRQLAPVLDRVHLWFWGHEHKLAGYEAYAPEGTTPVRARCIGHGGMPIELPWTPKRDAPIVFSDERTRGSEDAAGKLGYCGFALLTLAGRVLAVTYIDETGQEILEEKWERTNEGIAGSARVLLTGAPGLHLYRDISRLAL